MASYRFIEWPPKADAKMGSCYDDLPQHQMKVTARLSQARHGKLTGKLDDLLLQLKNVAILAALRLQEPAPLLQLGIWALCLELLGNFDPPAGMRQSCHLMLAMPHHDKGLGQAAMTAELNACQVIHSGQCILHNNCRVLQSHDNRGDPALDVCSALGCELHG